MRMALAGHHFAGADCQRAFSKPPMALVEIQLCGGFQANSTARRNPQPVENQSAEKPESDGLLADNRRSFLL
jgi:hypothetical protein